MADVFTKEKRSKVMSRIRGRGNERTELALVRLFRANESGLRWLAMMNSLPPGAVVRSDLHNLFPGNLECVDQLVNTHAGVELR